MLFGLLWMVCLPGVASLTYLLVLFFLFVSPSLTTKVLKISHVMSILSMKCAQYSVFHGQQQSYCPHELYLSNAFGVASCMSTIVTVTGLSVVFRINSNCGIFDQYVCLRFFCINLETWNSTTPMHTLCRLPRLHINSPFFARPYLFEKRVETLPCTQE